MKTADLKALVREVLESLPKPYSEHVIDEVFGAIEQNARWRREYDTLCSTLGKTVVNTWGGYWIGNLLGKVGERVAPSKRSTLIGSYSLLDTDAKTVARKPNETEALQLMSAYYQAHRSELSPQVRKHRELLVELLMEGMSPEDAFNMVLKSDA
jgi:hypothetical protein